MLQLKETDKGMIESELKKLLEERRGKLASIEAENEEYDENMAKIKSNAEEELYEDDTPKDDDAEEGGDEE
jgi:hypothetical protein